MSEWTTIIERVAKALWETRPNGPYPWSEVSGDERLDMMKAARAAIEAMRSPTVNMHNAACGSTFQAKPASLSVDAETGIVVLKGYKPADPSGLWRVMIETALGVNNP